MSDKDYYNNKITLRTNFQYTRVGNGTILIAITANLIPSHVNNITL